MQHLKFALQQALSSSCQTRSAHAPASLRHQHICKGSLLKLLKGSSIGQVGDNALLPSYGGSGQHVIGCALIPVTVATAEVAQQCIAQRSLVQCHVRQNKQQNTPQQRSRMLLWVPKLRLAYYSHAARAHHIADGLQVTKHLHASVWAACTIAISSNLAWLVLLLSVHPDWHPNKNTCSANGAEQVHPTVSHLSFKRL